MIGQRVGHYRIIDKLGEGGMGVVYHAHDERLDRPVALKLLREFGDRADLRERFWREARAAAQMNHPNVCQIYEIGEDSDRPFLVMELLEGESIGRRLERGPLQPREAIDVTVQMLTALSEMHRRGIVHRDLKPSNLYLTPHGVKLLDFGLARWVDSQQASSLTQPGSIVGTSFYMAPEQALGRPFTPVSDLFSAGVMLYEMLSGRRPFDGKSTPEVLYNIVNEQPAALGGSSEALQINTVIERALQKEPVNRFQSAAEMIESLRAITPRPLTSSGSRASSGSQEVRVRAVTRLIVLPFRMLVPDRETEFLAFSLPDALSSTLSQIESLVVRSTLVASRFAADHVDLEALAAQAQVDAVLTGTILRAGDQIRLSTQLIEVPGGTVLHSISSQAALRDLFKLQDDLAHSVVESLAIRLSARDDRLMKRDVPASPSAYEYYLRGSRYAYDWNGIATARDLFLQCVEQDPNYAPAWARLGRCYRVLAKYKGLGPEEFKNSEDAFRRALELNPDLPLAHNLYAHLEADLGRAQQAMQRLLARAQVRRNDPELFAGLVHVCRYCGLLNASVEAHERARRLDPEIPTSIAHTYFVMGDYERSLSMSSGDIGYVEGIALIALGRAEEVALDLRKRLADSQIIHDGIKDFMLLLLHFTEGNYAQGIEHGRRMFVNFTDPEGYYYWTRQLSRAGEGDEAMEALERSVEGGYFCATTLVHDPWLQPLLRHPQFAVVQEKARQKRNAALALFQQAGGQELLGRGDQPT